MAEIGTIAEGLRIVGEVRGRGDLRIDGVVDGVVRVEGSVSITAKGLVEGSVEADRLRIDGRLVGNGLAHERLETGPNACVDGDLEAPSVLIDPLSAITGEVFGATEAKAAPRGVRRRRGSSPESVRRAVPEPKMPVMLRAKGVRRSIA
jgi:cytoskeletal protein CcmA (bactofilin family)